MGERNNPDAGETTLAAATAAIITARWSARPAVPTGHAAQGTGAPANGAVVNGGPAHDGNGHGAGGGNGHRAGDAFSEWVPPAPPSGALTAPTFGGPSTSPASPAAPYSPAPHSPAAPYSPAPHSPAAPYSPAPHSPAAPYSPAPHSPAPYGAAAPAPAGSYFSPVTPDPVPEVFEPRGGAPEGRTQVPPGFERRTFGPFPDERDVGAHARPEEPRAPEGLLGVLPPLPTTPMPASFAPPEPAPWVDAGWVDFPRDVEPQPAEAPVSSGAPASAAPAAARPVLPRRVPRVPDDDYPLFESDPAEPAPDPVAQRQELSRIATFLREPGGVDGAAAGARPDGVDLQAVLGAVRQVPEVRDAQLGWNEQAGHTLRIEFIDGVDESVATRSVVRLLRSRLGLPTPGAEEPTLDRPFSPRGRAARPGAASTTGGGALPRPSGGQAPRLVLENVTVTRLGAEASVTVRLRQPVTGAPATGEGRGPGVDAYLSRLAATAAASAVDQALADRGKVFVEHVSVVPFGVVEVAVVVLLLSYRGVTEQLSGSAIVGDDPHAAVARAVLGALNRRLESLLA